MYQRSKFFFYYITNDVFNVQPAYNIKMINSVSLFYVNFYSVFILWKTFQLPRHLWIEVVALVTTRVVAQVTTLEGFIIPRYFTFNLPARFGLISYIINFIDTSIIRILIYLNTSFFYLIYEMLLRLRENGNTVKSLIWMRYAIEGNTIDSEDGCHLP